MNLTKSLKWAMVCAGVTAFSVSAQNVWVAEPFDYTLGLEMWGFADWSRSGSNDDSKIAEADAARLGFIKCGTPLGLSDGRVLELNTEGDTLELELPQFVDFSLKDGNVQGENEEDIGVYVDMMVKFVLSEEKPDEPDSAVKTLIYADAEGQLNVWSFDGLTVNGFSALNNDPIDPEQWYRLTLTWFAWGGWTPAFTIQLNGGEPLKGSFGYDYETGSIDGESVFMSAAVYDQFDPPEAAMTLYAIQFQGTGFIDELVVTDVVDFGDVLGDVTFADTGKVVNPTDFDNWLKKNYAAGNDLGTLGASSETASMWNAYLLNVLAGDGSIEAKLTIIDIIPETGGGATVQLGAVDGTGEEVPFQDPYGTLKLFRTASLESPFVLFDTIPKANTDTYLIPGDGEKYFYRATIE